MAEVDRCDIEAWQALDLRKAWEAFKVQRIKALERSLGSFSDRPSRIEHRLTGEIESVG